jgi:hypothetical protein
MHYSGINRSAQDQKNSSGWFHFSFDLGTCQFFERSAKPPLLIVFVSATYGVHHDQTSILSHCDRTSAVSALPASYAFRIGRA